MEQYINAKKADFFNDPEAKEKIMKLKIPIECRKVKIANFDQGSWEKVAKTFLYDGMMAKVCYGYGLRS